MVLNKYTKLLLAGVLVLGACAPRAKKQTLAEIEECQKALSSAEARKAELVSGIEAKKTAINEKKAQIQNLEAERDSLSYWLHEVLEKGY